MADLCNAALLLTMEDIIELGQSSYGWQVQLLGSETADKFMTTLVKITLFSRYVVDTLNLTVDEDWSLEIRMLSIVKPVVIHHKNVQILNGCMSIIL